MLRKSPVTLWNWNNDYQGNKIMDAFTPIEKFKIKQEVKH